MKRHLFMIMIPMTLAAWFCAGPVAASANRDPKVYAIGLRASHWPIPVRENRFDISTLDGIDGSLSTEGFGGNVYFTSRMDRNWVFEVTLGGTGSAEGNFSYDYDCWFDDQEPENFAVDTISMLLFGLRFQPIGTFRAPIRPYIAAGIGPYWITQVESVSDGLDDRVVTKWRGRHGGYLGAGIDMQVASWLGFNFDMKYHFVNFDQHNNYSELEYGIGFQIQWGRFVE